VRLGKNATVFSEPGIDAYWSPSGNELIYFSYASRSVSIWNRRSGSVRRDVASVEAGDYFSWGNAFGRDLVVTIQGNFYYLDTNSRGSFSHLPSCGEDHIDPSWRARARPLLSKDGRMVSMFLGGLLVIRGALDCGVPKLETGISAAKADFSWDGRYVAFHRLKPDATGYEIDVIDIKRQRLIHVTDLPGSSYFPSWTKNGSLSFRYDSDIYRGFVISSNFLGNPSEQLPDRRTVPRVDVLNELTKQIPKRIVIYHIWAPWNAHSYDSLTALQRLQNERKDVSVLIAAEPGSLASDIADGLKRYQIGLPSTALGWKDLPSTGADIQVPMTLIFVKDRLVDFRFGTDTYEGYSRWLDILTSQ